MGKAYLDDLLHVHFPVVLRLSASLVLHDMLDILYIFERQTSQVSPETCGLLLLEIGTVS